MSAEKATDVSLTIGAPPAATPAQTSEAEMKQLLADILNEPERLFDEKVSAEQVLELQRQLNPYSFAVPPLPGGGQRMVAATFTNLRAAYFEHFYTTSVIAFLFQMLKEWEAPANVRRWTPAARRGRAAAAPADPKDQPFEPARLVAHLEAALATAREAQKAADEHKAARA